MHFIQQYIQRKKIFIKTFLLLFVFFGVFSFSFDQQAVAVCQNWFDSVTGIPCSAGLVAPNPGKVQESGISTKTLKTQVLDLINYFLTFLGIVAVAGVIYSGGLMVTAMGDGDQFEKGKKGIGYMVIGVLVILLSYAIVNWALSVSGRDASQTSTEDFDSGSSYAGYGDNFIDFGDSNTTNYGSNYYPEHYQYNFPNNPAQYNLEELRNWLIELRPEVSNVEGNLQGKIDKIIQLLNVYQNNPTNENWQNFINEYQDIWTTIAKMPVMQARITATPVSGRAPLLVALDGLKSSDPKNVTIPDANYTWTYLDTKGAEVILPHKSVVDTEFTEPGTYIVKLRVKSSSVNQNGETTVLPGFAFHKIVVLPSVIDFKLLINNEEVNTFYKATNELAKKGLEFNLSETTFATWRNVVNVMWEFGDATYDERYDLNSIVHSYAESREYNVKVTVKDNFKDIHIRRFKVLVKPVLAKFEITPKEGNLNQKFVFDSSRSEPSADKIVEYLWQIDDQDGKRVIESAEKRLEYVFLKPGKYTINLTIRDSYNDKDTTSKTLIVQSRKPTAVFDWKIEHTSQPNKIIFDASRSFDPEGEPLLFDWDFDGDGVFDLKEEKNYIVEHTFEKKGKYKTKVRVSDPYDNVETYESLIEVKSILSVNFTPSLYASAKDEELTFKADAPSAVTYYWNFGDGSIFQNDEPEIKYTFKKTGEYMVTLKVFNTENQENEIQKKIYVGDGKTPLAIAEVSVDNKILLPQENLCNHIQPGIKIYRNSKVLFKAEKAINGKGSNTNLEYIWDFGDGVLGNQRDMSHFYNELSAPNQCLTARLTIKDKLSGQTSQSREINLQVVNKLPELSYLEIAPQTKLITPVTFKLNAHGVTDFDGKVIKYRWWYYSEDNSEPRGVQTTSVPYTSIVVMGEGLPDQKKNYFFVVELTDDNNGTINSNELFHHDVPYLIENGKNVSPIVDFSMDKTVVYLGDSINFFATAYDPQGWVIPTSAYKWDFDGDGKFDDVSSGSKVSRRYNLPGEFSVRLKVDLNGLSTSQVKKIVVKRVSDFPEAAFTYYVDGLTAYFDWTNSRFDDKLDDKKLWYSWDFDTLIDVNGNGIKNDDDQDNKLQTQFTYTREWRYQVRLSVKDVLGVTDYVEREIVIGNTSFSEPLSVTSVWSKLESLHITSDKNSISTLDLFMPKVDLKPNDTIDITARILQASGDLYQGVVLYRVVEWSGLFIPSQVNAKNGVAISTFKADSVGMVTVEVSVPGVLGGPLIEKISFNIR